VSRVKSAQPSVPQPVIDFNVKLAPKAGREMVKHLSSFPGVTKVVQTFPGEHDPELSRLYVLKLNPSRAKAAVKKLRKHPGIEYVEASAPRKLIW
jgi:hypothetical protein